LVASNSGLLSTATGIKSLTKHGQTLREMKGSMSISTRVAGTPPGGGVTAMVCGVDVTAPIQMPETHPTPPGSVHVPLTMLRSTNWFPEVATTLYVPALRMDASNR